MPVAIRIDAKTGVAIASCSGTLTREDAESAVDTLWKTASWDGRAAVWNFCAAHFDVSTADARSVAHFVQHNQPVPPPAKIAFVTPSDADFGMARMFAVFREDPATAFRVFRDEEPAMAWASSPDSGPD